MIGVGITPEGINQNYIIYEFALDRAWYHDPTDVFKWINEYTLTRYGFENEHVQKAWKLLKVRSVQFYLKKKSVFFIVFLQTQNTNSRKFIHNYRRQFIRTTDHLIMGNMLFVVVHQLILHHGFVMLFTNFIPNKCPLPIVLFIYIFIPISDMVQSHAYR